MKLRILALATALAACGSPPQPAPAPAPPASLSAPQPVAPAALAPPSPASASASAAPAQAAPPSCSLATQPEHVLPNQVRSLSLGRPPYAAVLSNQPWMFDGKAWKELPIPKRLAPAPDEHTALGIFFGRDDKPRLMGARWDASSDAAHSRQVYLRYREGAWQRDPKEIGRLGSGADAGMYGVLGNDDPELVCKLRDACIIKRRTGWTTIAAGAELAQTWLCNGSVFVLDSRGMARLDGAAFTQLPWQFEGRGHETGFWADAASTWWVAAASQDALYRYHDNTWTRVPAPAKQPQALWAASASDVWVVGEDGAAHFDGAAWCRVAGLAGPLEHVSGRAGEVWFGGRSGLWKLKAP